MAKTPSKKSAKAPKKAGDKNGSQRGMVNQLHQQLQQQHKTQESSNQPPEAITTADDPRQPFIGVFGLLGSMVLLLVAVYADSCSMSQIWQDHAHLDERLRQMVLPPEAGLTIFGFNNTMIFTKLMVLARPLFCVWVAWTMWRRLVAERAQAASRADAAAARKDATAARERAEEERSESATRIKDIGVEVATSRKETVTATKNGATDNERLVR
ncbi:unnamed protein product [Ectocarpus sp. 12 AP-2014]